MTDLAIAYAGIFDGFLKPIEGAAKINASLIEEADGLVDEKIYRLLELQVENNKKITPNKFNNLKNRNCVVGNPEDLVHIDWSEQWKPLISYDY